MARFFVLSHHYNDTRSWWEPYFGDQLAEADDMDAMIERLRYPGLYRIYEVVQEASTQVEEVTEVRRHTNRTHFG